MAIAKAWRAWMILPWLSCAWVLAGAEPGSDKQGLTPGAAKQASETTPAIHKVTGITKPNRTATLTALQPARVARIEIAEGAFVEQGALLVLLDDGVQRVLTEKARAEADSLLPVELARVEMEQADADLERITRLSGGDSASHKELQDAKVEARTRRMKHAAAVLEHEQMKREYDFQRLLLERLHIRAPFSGHVSEIFKETGETALEADDILTLVELNPLEVSMDCPLELVRGIRVDHRVLVQPVDKRWESRTGKVVFVSPVVDPASRTFKVKLLVDNSDGQWIPGLKVQADFSAAALTRRVNQKTNHADGPEGTNPATAQASKKPAAN